MTTTAAIARHSGATAVVANRKAASREGTIGGPCHAIKRDGYYCTRPATTIGDDGYGYCARHAKAS